MKMNDQIVELELCGTALATRAGAKVLEEQDMNRVARLCCVAYIITLLPAAVQAQGRTPRTDSAAVGGEAGLFLPRADDLKSGLDLFGFYEYYLAPRTSLRLGLEWMHPDYDEDRDPDASVRMIRIGGDMVYNWEGGTIHPFAGAGLGVYIIQPRNNGQNEGDSESKFGGSLFGGLEFFTNRTTSVKAEARYHVVPNVNGFNPDGLSLTVGLKKYF
jgi:opacity protein-like surface antigen